MEILRYEWVLTPEPKRACVSFGRYLFVLFLSPSIRMRGQLVKWSHPLHFTVCNHYHIYFDDEEHL